MHAAHIPEQEILEVMIGAALEAGRLAHDVYRGDFEIQRKADQSPVTVADQAAEALILQHLVKAVPTVPVVAEEEFAAGRIPRVAESFFLVDPLDGTKEFIHRRGDFTVNIALIRDGAPLLGVVYAPVNASLYVGNVAARSAFRSTHHPDLGARAGETAARVPIRVRAAPAEGLTAVVSRSHATPETDAYLASYTIKNRVSVGSSLKFCLVAAGEADLYPRLGPTMEWDTAAGHAVLAAAGGTVIAPGGGALRYGKPDFRNSYFIASGFTDPVPLAA